MMKTGNRKDLLGNGQHDYIKECKSFCENYIYLISHRWVFPKVYVSSYSSMTHLNSMYVVISLLFDH